MKKFARFAAGTVSIAILAASIYGIFNRQAIFDYFALRNYSPNDRIVTIADETTMTDAMRRVFYINHPQLNDRQEFRKNCPSGEASIVLGCYIQRRGIFLHDVSDERLSGVVQVTAAHETLHAQYDRLSNTERSRVDKMVNDQYARLPDERIKQTVEKYRAKDPDVVANELHSILGTEVRTLPAELENYYSRYFRNRVQVVAYSEKYEQTFVDLTEQVKSYDRDLSALKTRINSNQVEIQGLNNELERQKNRLDSLLDDGQTEEYNDAVPPFNELVANYNSLIARTRAMINDYNSIVEKRNSIATTEQQLIEAINSNAVPRQRE